MTLSHPTASSMPSRRPPVPCPPACTGSNFHISNTIGHVICGFNPTHNNYSTYDVTVTAPYGTLHEAFFDPVTVGTAVKADGSNGVLKPTSFTVGGTVHGDLRVWNGANNQVVLTLGTHVSLSGQVLEFIGLDGNIILSIFADDATANSTAGTYSWPMTTEPWENDDKLMLRIRKLLPEVSLTNMPTSLEQGSAHWFTVDAGKPGLSRRATATVCLRTMANAELLTTASGFALRHRSVTTTVTAGCNKPFPTFPEAEKAGALFPQRVNTSSMVMIP